MNTQPRVVKLRPVTSYTLDDVFADDVNGYATPKYQHDYLLRAKGCWIVVQNSSPADEAWTEEFDSLRDAVRWLRDKNLTAND